MITKTIDYEDGSRLLEGYLAYHDTGQSKPAVLVAHDWSGRREFACKAAERIGHESVAAALLAVIKGARIIRVHDVKASKDTLAIYHAMKNYHAQ